MSEPRDVLQYGVRVEVVVPKGWTLLAPVPVGPWKPSTAVAHLTGVGGALLLRDIELKPESEALYAAELRCWHRSPEPSPTASFVVEIAGRAQRDRVMAGVDAKAGVTLSAAQAETTGYTVQFRLLEPKVAGPCADGDGA